MNVLTIEILRCLIKILFIQQALAEGHKVKYLGENKYKFTLNTKNTETTPSSKKFINKFTPDFIKQK